MFEQVTVPVGQSIPVVALSINCASPDQPVATQVFTNGGTLVKSFDLLDDGAAPDEVAGDGEAAGSWQGDSPGQYVVKLWNGEAEKFEIELIAPTPTP